MIAHLSGKIFDKNAPVLNFDISGVGYEVFCSIRTLEVCGEEGDDCALYIHSHYRAEAVSLYGFLARQEKDLFLSLLKVDSVGPKSALNIIASAPWLELAHLINAGQAEDLAKLPKISKKIAEHLVVKLKGKLDDLLLGQDQAVSTGHFAVDKSIKSHKLKNEAHSALTHLGYRPGDVDRLLNTLPLDVWDRGLESIIRHALSELSGNA